MPTPEEAIQGIETRLEALEGRYRQSISAAATIDELDRARACLLGKQSDFTEALRMLGDAPADRRVELGGRINGFRRDVVTCYRSRAVELDPRMGESLG